MTLTTTGSSRDYADGWQKIFSGKPSRGSAKVSAASATKAARKSPKSKPAGAKSGAGKVPARKTGKK